MRERRVSEESVFLSENFSKATKKKKRLLQQVDDEVLNGETLNHAKFISVLNAMCFLSHKTRHVYCALIQHKRNGCFKRQFDLKQEVFNGEHHWCLFAVSYVSVLF